VAVVASVVAVQVTATPLVTPDPNAGVNDPTPFAVYNGSGATIYLGGTGVTDATGFPLLTGSTFQGNLFGSDTIYAIAAAPENINVLMGRQ
jgi:hypothetical protein